MSDEPPTLATLHLNFAIGWVGTVDMDEPRRGGHEIACEKLAKMAVSYRNFFRRIGAHSECRMWRFMGRRNECLCRFCVAERADRNLRDAVSA